MNILFFGVTIFILSLLVLEFTLYAIRLFRHPDQAEIRKRLRRSLIEEGGKQGNDILRKRVLSDMPFLNRILSSLPVIERIQLTINQANVKYTLGFFTLLSIALGLAAYMTISVITGKALLPFLAAIVSACLPIFYVKSKKKTRMAKFEKQLPEALSLIARALRAGHAFVSGMKLASEEFTDPLGPEFEETLDEINFGVSVADALKNLARRVDCTDLRFFVVSVILQRETGGNLAEIIEGLASLIRERFKFRGKVRVLSAEGRISAAVLTVLPFLLFFVLYLLNPEYTQILIFDPIGRVVAVFSGIMMFIGLIIIKRIINIEV